MKRFLTSSLLALILLMGVAPAVLAQDTGPGPDATPSAADSSQTDPAPAPGTYTSVFTNKAAEETTTSLPVDPPNSGVIASVVQWIMKLFAWLVGVAAVTLDYAVYYTVVVMGDYVNKLSAVGVTWQIFRDIGNILLIFGFLAAGIMTILNAEHFGFGKKMLPMLLVAAVFLNFSLFFAEAIVDTGNLFATQFYTQIKGGSLPTDTYLSSTSFLDQIEREGISNKIMSQLGLQGIYSDALTNKALFESGNSLIIGFLGILLFLITAFVLFSLAFILIARFVILLLLIIIAPVGFAGLAIPKLANAAKLWWNSLFEQTFIAPILLLCLYIALAIITDVQFLRGFGVEKSSTGFWTGVVAGGNVAGFASMILSFLVAMGLLLAVVIISKKMSAFGAGWATKTAGAASFGLTAWAGRNTGGWLASKTARGLRNTWVSRVPLAGTGLVKGLEKVGAASFDVRGIKRFGGLKTLGIDAEDAQKGGYKAELKARIESRTKYATDLKGRELTDTEKLQQAKAKNDIKDLDKAYKAVGAQWATADNRRREDLRRLEEARNTLSEEEYKTRRNTINESMKGIEEDLKKAKETLDKRQTELDEIESVTDAGAKRKYARTLNLWTDEKNTFNTVFNFAGNTEAAKKIREDAKKSKDDKELDVLRKALKKVSGEEEEEKEEKPSAPPASGGAPAAP